MNKRRDIFLWGAATSSHQVEGNNRLNDWWEWERSGRVKEKSGAACDHYNRFRDDFGIARKLGHTAHRLSLEWSRLEPEEGRWDESEWSHYKEVIRALGLLEIEPVLTLNHFTIPLWLYKKGGWLSRESIPCFEAFARKAVEALGENVSYWITVNEPLVHAFMAYMRGIWPPGRACFKDALTVIENQIHAHARAYRAMHEVQRNIRSREIFVGVAHNVEKFYPDNPASPADRLACLLRHRFYNLLFIQSVMDGFILSPGSRPQRLAARRALDFIGLNYYTSSYIRFKGFCIPEVFGEPNYKPREGVPDWRNTLGWRVYPQGIYPLLMDFSKYALPIMITENGMSAANDMDRSRFIIEHLRWIFRAKEEGAWIIGYLYWSLLDNFEWADGYGPRFGIVGVNYADQVRTVRPSALDMSGCLKKHLSGQARLPVPNRT